MNVCLEADDLVALGAAVQWDVDGVLEHLAGCDNCREQLRGLRAVYRAAADTITPVAGFSEAVMQAVGERHAAQTRSRFPMISLLAPALAAMTTLFAVLTVSSGDPAAWTGIPVLVTCGAAGLGSLWWNRFNMSTVPPT